MPLITERRLCPPDAWRDGSQPLMRDSAYVDPELRLLIKTRLDRGVEDVARQETLCGRLGLRAAAMANEGYVVHSPGREELLAALMGGRCGGFGQRAGLGVCIRAGGDGRGDLLL